MDWMKQAKMKLKGPLISPETATEGGVPPWRNPIPPVEEGSLGIVIRITDHQHITEGIQNIGERIYAAMKNYRLLPSDLCKLRRVKSGQEKPNANGKVLCLVLMKNFSCRKVGGVLTGLDNVLRAGNLKRSSSTHFVDFGDTVLRKHVLKHSLAVEGAVSQLGALRRSVVGHEGRALTCSVDAAKSWGCTVCVQGWEVEGGCPLGGCWSHWLWMFAHGAEGTKNINCL
ncbi:uncharacterized protein [Struthio camelus]|uniref:uncharacterized protein isoform X2 n=1 Tax=Struthio camelus TaxID=8801 RepID=UPI003603C684